MSYFLRAAVVGSFSRAVACAWAGILLLPGCGAPAIGADAGRGDPPDAGGGEAARREAPPPTCTLEQAPLAEPAVANAVLATPDHVFIGDGRGLWRTSGVGERFEHLTGSPPGVYLTLTRVDDGAIFAVLGDGRVVWSWDEGEHWDEIDDLRPRASGAPRLYTDGARIVGAIFNVGGGVETIHDLDRATGGWAEIVAAEPVEGWGHSGFALVGVDRGALLATPNGSRSGGLFRLDRGAPRWVHVEGMDENGYSTFARRGDVAVVASPAGIWAEIDGSYRPALAQVLSHPILVPTADGFLGVHAGGVLRSADGIAWTVEPFVDGRVRAPALLSESGGCAAMLASIGRSFYPSDVSLSDDGGTSWRAPSIVSQTFERVAAHGEGADRIRYVSRWAGGSTFDPLTWRGGGWTSFAWPLPVATAVAMTGGGAWACAYTGCVHRTDDGEVGPTIAMLKSSYAYEPRTAFATSHGLFVSPRPYGTQCGAVQPGLIVLRDDTTGTWEDASAGLRSWTPACAGTPSVATVSAMHELDGALWATQAHAYLSLPFTPLVLRSIDGGRSWRAMREGVELVALVRAEAGAFGLFRPGVIEALDATGDTFAPAPAQPGDVVTDLVALEGWLVAATAGADDSALWLSDDGARSWKPLVTDARIGPITDLDAHGAVLTVAARRSGLWEASGCFQP
jgi:hypothetical protein